MFDPYHKWLGIPRELQPPTYYLLLGIAPTEADPEVIEEAAIRQTAHVRTYQTGSHGTECTRLLNEIAEARTTLLNPVKRHAYDSRLAAQARPVPTAQPVTARAPDSVANLFADLAASTSAEPASSGTRLRTQEEKSKKSPWLWLGLGGVAAGIVVVVVLVFLFRGDSTTPEIVKNPDADQPAKTKPQLAVTPTFVALPTDLNLASGQPRTLTLRVHRNDLPGALRADLRGLPKGVQFRTIEGGEDTDRVVLELTADPDAQAGESDVTVIAQIDKAATEGRFRLTVVKPQAVVVANFAPDRPFLNGRWRLEGQELVQDEDAVANLFFGDPKWTDYSVFVEVRKVRGDDGCNIAFRAGRSDHCVWLTLGGYGNSKHALELGEAGKPAVRLHERPGSLVPDRWYKVVIHVRGEYVKCELDDGTLFEITLDSRAHAQGGVGLRGRTATRFRNLLVTDSAGAVVHVNGVQQIDRGGKRIVQMTVKPKDPPTPVVPLVEAAKLKPGSLRSRGGAARKELLKEGGATTESEAAVAAGLRWLIAQQNRATGGWTLGGYDRDHGTANNDIAATALALLPLLAQEAPFKSKQSPHLVAGVNFLVSKQGPSGDFGAGMYAQGLATMALCEAVALYGNKAWRLAGQRAVNYLAQAQHSGGGWRYQPGQAGDLSVTAWQVQALKAAEQAGIQVPEIVWKRLPKFLDAVGAPDGSGFRYFPEPNFPVTAAMTAAGLGCRLAIGWEPKPAEAEKLVETLRQTPPFAERQMYYHYYATQALRHLGGRAWQEWFPKMREELVNFQEDKTADPRFRGSWPPIGDSRGREGGRLLTTSLSLLVLQSPYRHVPLFVREQKLPAPPP